MKKFIFFTSLILLAISVRSQVTVQEPVRTGKRFFVGISYSYLSMDLKLSAMSLHSNWYGTDMGTNNLSADELEEVNSIVNRNTRVNYLSVNAGMEFTNNPGSKWHFTGTLNLGIAGLMTEVHNTSTDSLEYIFDSDFSKPCLGFVFNVGYSFDKHWGLSLLPRLLGSMSKVNKINDMVNPDPINFTPVKQEKNSVIYFRSDLLANYSIGPVSLYMGPGFYFFWSKHQYRREYTNINTGDVLIEEANSTLVPEMFVDGSIAVEWRIIEILTFNAHAGIGKDLILDAGIHYNF